MNTQAFDFFAWCVHFEEPSAILSNLDMGAGEPSLRLYSRLLSKPSIMFARYHWSQGLPVPVKLLQAAAAQPQTHPRAILMLQLRPIAIVS